MRPPDNAILGAALIALLVFTGVFYTSVCAGWIPR